MDIGKTIQNFGRNVQFTPQKIYHPASDTELLKILERHNSGRIRVGGTKHAWSDAIHSDDAFIDMGGFNDIQIDGDRVTVGAGCQIRSLLNRLNSSGLTMPSVGLIDEQTVAGAIATGTHGSGKHSLSHYVQAMRVACFDATGEQAHFVDIDSNTNNGTDLQAARCSLGCLGVVTEVTLPVIAQYAIQEKTTPCGNLNEALSLEQQSPLQQFFLFPHTWTIFAQERSVAAMSERSGSAWLYRLYWILALDVGIHLLVKLFATVLRSRRLIHLLFRSIIPASLFPRWIVVDRSDKQLVMNHELFRHFEMELFVRRAQLTASIEYLKDVVSIADSAEHALSSQTQEQLRSIGMRESINALGGTFTHHYPICVRRIVPDETMLSMSCGDAESKDDWYSISLITYRSPRDDFCAVATFLAHSMASLFSARVHWGKWFPQTEDQVALLYPRLAEFREVCMRYDPNGVFRNEFVNDKLGFSSPNPS